MSILAAVQSVAPALTLNSSVSWAAILTNAFRDGGIDTPKRVAAFLGQIAVESEAFTHLQEDLYYSTPERLCAVYPSHFTSLDDASLYIKNPEKLANHVYCNRMGNGDEASGDGWKFRGLGLIQITGRYNYTQFATTVGKAPEDAATWILSPEGSAASAVWFWNMKKLNDLADIWNITKITISINGGQNALAQRLLLSNAALKVFDAEEIP